jgi:ABC-type glycerol-3-phosphate transport system substrate-binding protein
MSIPENPDEAIQGESVKVALDPSPNVPPFDWFTDEIQKDTGVSLSEKATFPFGNLYDSYNTEFTSSNSPGDSHAVVFYPRLLGTFAENGHLQQLDDLAEVWDPQLDGVIDRYKQLYTSWGGSTYALPMDGDVQCLMYRRDLFEEHDIDVPSTWQEFNEVARYFTEETDDVEYGTSTFGARSFGFGWFLNRFGGLGGKYFDENMNPGFNTEAGRRALEHWQETIQYCPPETTNYGYTEIRRAFTQGQVAMNIQWNDAPKKAMIEGSVGENWGAAPVPGWSDGEAVSVMPAGRVIAVPSYVSDQKKLAAYRWIQAFTSPKFSNEMCTDPQAGEDPFRESHMQPDLYTRPNRSRDFSGDANPEDSICFPSREMAQRYTNMTRANLEQGYPIPNWPGAPQYTEIMGRECSRFVAGEQGVEETLTRMDEQFTETLDELGRETQSQYYDKVIEAWKNAGLWS